MNISYMLAGIAVMSGVTWAIRMIPLAVIRKRFKSRFLLSLLYYLPYGVLAAMIFPAVFTSCGEKQSSGADTTAASGASFKKHFREGFCQAAKDSVQAEYIAVRDFALPVRG